MTYMTNKISLRALLRRAIKNCEELLKSTTFVGEKSAITYGKFNIYS